MRVLRPLINYSALCVALGIAGGLLFGVVLSHNGGWLTPVPWSVYLLVLLAAVSGVSVLDARHAAAQRLDAWPLPPGYGSEFVAETAPDERSAVQLDAAEPPAEQAHASDETKALPAAARAAEETAPWSVVERADDETLAFPGRGAVGAAVAPAPAATPEASTAGVAIQLAQPDGTEHPAAGEVDGGSH